MENRVFISYARLDGENFSRRLYDDLQDDEFNPWLDVYEIKSGNYWDSEIDIGLQTAEAVLVVLTPGSVSSKQVASEWNDAINQYKPVIPILHLDCNIPRILQTLQFIDFRENYKKGLSKLRRRLRNLESDYSKELKSILATLKKEQSMSPTPERFKDKIDDLEKVIASWGKRLEDQHLRIEHGLREERQAIIQESRRQQHTDRQRVVGHRLPVIPDQFVGRSQEQTEISRLLADQSKHIVSIVGHNGLGKTALASKILFDLEQNKWHGDKEKIQVDGIVYLSTQTGGITLEQLFFNCAKMLGGERQKALHQVWSNPQTSVEDKVLRLLEALRSGLYVILFDHMNKLLDDHGNIMDEDLRIFFEKSLIFPHNARFIVTTRYALKFGESVMSTDKPVTLDGLSEEEGIAMLRKLDYGNNCGLRDAPDDQLARAVLFLHGIPRALERLAGILAEDPLSSLEDILERFYEDQVIVNDLIEGGYRRLDSDARRVMEALAVFGRPVPRTAVDYLLEPFVPGLNLPSVINRLYRAQMVIVDRPTKHISLQPIDQDFAYRRCPLTEEYNCRILERRAADYYAQLRTEPSHWRTIAGLTPLLHQFDHLVRAMEFDRAAELLSEFDLDYLIMRGYAKRALNMRRMIDGKIKDKRLLMLHKCGMGRAYAIVGPFTEATTQYKDALGLARDLKDQNQEAEILGWLGEAARRENDLDKAKDYLERSVQIFRGLGNRSKEEARWLVELSLVCSYEGDLEAALRNGQNALKLATHLNDTTCLALAHDCISLAYLILGRLEDVLQHADAALQNYQQSRWISERVYVLNVKALAYIGKGRFEKGLSILQEAQSQAHEDNNVRIEWVTLFNLARLYRKQKSPEMALEAVRRSEELLLKSGPGWMQAAIDLSKAIEAEKTGNKWSEAKALLDCAAHSLSNPDLLTPQDLIQEACDIAETEGMNELLERGKTILNDLKSRQHLAI